MKETNYFYWKNGQGNIEKHHIREFKALLFHEVESPVEQRKEDAEPPEPVTVYGPVSREILPSGGGPEKEVTTS